MTVNPRQSFKLKLCLSILASTIFIFLLIFLSPIYFTSKEIKRNVAAIVSSKLDLATNSMDDILSEIEVASSNLIGLLGSPLVNYDLHSAGSIPRTYLESNPAVQGVCIGYEDGTEFGHPGPWCPYVMRRNGEYIHLDLSEMKDFRASEWYKTPAESRRPSWSVPFRESNGTIITSYNVPVVKDGTNKLLCVVAVDLNLNDLSDSLQTLSPYKGSKLYLVDSKGCYIAHPDHSFVLEQNAPEEIMEQVRSGAEYFSVKEGKDDVYIFPARISKTGWTVLMSIPRDAMVSSTWEMFNTMIINMLIGIILLLGVSVLLINRLTKPLISFADAAKQIAHGDFHVELPEIQDHNELYDLRQALASMEGSLDEYMAKLELTSGQKASIEKELEIARNIQMAMVPKIFPPYPDRDNLDIFASLTPAQAVGGDLYDFVMCGNKFFFCIGDVSGKGIPAALLMAITRSLFRNTASEDKTPSQIAKIINNAITEGNDVGMFVTMMIASFDLETGELMICNCGHNLPATNGMIVDPVTMRCEPKADYHLINGIIQNIAIGVVPGFDYKDVTMNITPGCMLLLYTDGVTEAENMESKQYEEVRMLNLLKSMGSESSCRTIVTSLVEDVRKFTAGAQQSDDITVLCLRCTSLGIKTSE